MRKKYLINTLLIIVSCLWLVYCIRGIILNYSHYSLLDYVIVFAVMLLPFLIYFVIKKSQKRKKSVAVETTAHPKQNGHINASADKADSSVMYIVDDNTISRADGMPISDEEVPYLIELSKKRAFEIESRRPKHSDREEELVRQFIHKYGGESTRRCDEFSDLNRAAYYETDINKNIELLQQSLIAFEKAKQWHYNHSEGAKIYFQDFWERLHNSRNPCFSWDEPVKDELEFQFEKRDAIIPWIIESSKNGFMQPSIYERFPDIEKSVLRKIIDELVAQNADLDKTKKGNSYFIMQKATN